MGLLEQPAPGSLHRQHPVEVRQATLPVAHVPLQLQAIPWQVGLQHVVPPVHRAPGLIASSVQVPERQT